MMKWLWFSPLLLAIMLPVTATAQSTHQHAAAVAAPANIIDGAKTPNLIPDLTAWRLWLLSVTANDNDGTTAHLTVRQHAAFRTIGIREDEMPLAEEALSHFRAEYEGLMVSYNKQVNAGANPSLTLFLAQRDALVQATQTSLLGVLSPVTARTVRSSVIREKSRMRVVPEVQ